jgi:hypothetical protein
MMMFSSSYRTYSHNEICFVKTLLLLDFDFNSIKFALHFHIQLFHYIHESIFLITAVDMSRDELPVECLTSDLFFLRLFENQKAAAFATGITIKEIQDLCCDNDIEKNSSTVQCSHIKGLTFRYDTNTNRSTSSSVARIDPVVKNRRQVDVSVIRYLKEAKRDRRPDCRGQLEKTTVFREYVAIICLALDGTPMRKFTDVYTAASCLEGIAVAALKLALYAADNKVSMQ